MTNAQILANTKVGSVITNKQILSALKRKGLIFDYSFWGYLESCHVNYMKDKQRVYDTYVELFPNANAPKDKCYIDADYDGERIGGMIEYLGCKFDTKYLDGCFQPYLQLVQKADDTTKEVDPRMSLFGCVL